MRQDPFIHLDTPRDGFPSLESSAEITREDLIAIDAQYNGRYKAKHKLPKQKTYRGWRIFEKVVQLTLIIMVITIAVLFVFGYLKK